MAKDLCLKIATDSEIETMKDKIEQILQKKGLRIDHPELLRHVKKAGAIVDEETGYVRYPVRMQNELLSGMKKEFTLCGIDPKNDMPLPHPDKLFYSGSPTGCMHITPVDGPERKILKEDMPELFQLVNQMDNVNYYAIMTYDDPAVPPGASDINSLYYALNNSDKHGWIQPFGGENIKYILEMASVVVGGKANLAKRPIVTPFACATEPFIVKHMDAEIICRNAEYGVPVMCAGMPTAGVSAPITQPGVIMVTVAEILGLMLAVQCANPGLPCIAVAEHLMMDMKTTYVLQSNIETQMGRMLSTQIFQDGYNIPMFSWGLGNDALSLGAESSTASMLNALTSSLGDMTFLQGAGMYDTVRRYSPLKLIVDDEILGMMKVLKRGMAINEETMAFKDIMEMGEKPDIIANDHTLSHFREIYPLNIFNTMGRVEEKSASQLDLYDRARARYKSCESNFTSRSLPEEMDSELKKIVAQANDRLR